ncbi:hypothetical protein ABFX02_01G036300 [Erythranthe guttata]
MIASKFLPLLFIHPVFTTCLTQHKIENSSSDIGLDQQYSILCLGYICYKIGCLCLCWLCQIDSCIDRRIICLITYGFSLCSLSYAKMKKKGEEGNKP